MPYSGDPGASDIDAVRFYAQDTSRTAPLLSDAEVQYLIDQSGVDASADPWFVAAQAADAIAARYAGEVAISADGVNYSGDQLAGKYTQLGQQLRATEARLRGIGALPYVGGVKRGEPPPPDVLPPNFGVGMDDNPEAGYQGAGYNGDPDYHVADGQVGW